MRHRDKETVLEALEDWKSLRKKTTAEGGENYTRPVVVKFLDAGTFEVMDRDIVEDVFFVLRQHKILRELAPDGRDLDAAIRDASRDSKPRQQSARGPQRRPGGPGKQKPKGRPPKQGQPGQREGGQREGGQREGGQRDGSERRGPRRGRRRGRRTGRGGPRPPRDRGGPPPAA